MKEKVPETIKITGWRLKLGIGIFILSILLPLSGVPLIAMADLSTATTTTVTGIILAGSEVLGLIAVAIMGKDGYSYIKNLIYAFFKRYGPPAEVGRIRYRLGLGMFILPILFGWFSPYINEWIPAYADHELSYAIAGDVLLLTSLFVLGGNFWEKLRALFVYEAKAASSHSSLQPELA